jgi:hypothetical protein
LSPADLALARAPSAAFLENSWSLAAIATDWGFGVCAIAALK